MSLPRRALVLGAACSAVGAAQAQDAASPRPGERLAPWSPGVLDIHHIDTGAGNATFILGPDGTTILIDCGAVTGAPADAPLRPDASRRPGEWVARYALRQARAAGRTSLDYMVATHVHPDHVGAPAEGDPVAPDGVILTGLSQVDALMPAAVVIDRGFPDYSPLSPGSAPFAVNHQAWLNARVRSGRRVERAQVGSSRQLGARLPGAFGVRFVGGGGRVWTGEGEASRALIPPPAAWTAEARPEENHLSIALVLSFGAFRYFAGGDLVADTHDGAVPWLDVEGPIVRAAGKVNVASADHHGYFDADGPAFTRALDADVYVVQAWHATHPDMAVLQRLLNAWPGRASREVYITRLTAESRTTNGRFLPGVKSGEGHVVIRVQPDGRYRALVTDSRDETDTLLHVGESKRAERTGHDA